jgi:uncharacterized protein involved in high-affinity Fe2+ transport
MKHFKFFRILAGVAFSIMALSNAAATKHGKDPTKETVLIGVQTAAVGTPDEMLIKFELEPAKPMLMPPGMHGSTAMVMAPRTDEKYHFEVKPEDPKSKTRISYAAVRLTAVNTNNGKKVELDLHPMWGSSGLHYSANGPLPGDGIYTATVVVSPPTFARDATKEKDRWMRPLKAEFRFRFEKGLIIEN